MVTAIVKPAADLGQLAKAINGEHAKAATAVRTVITHAISAGDLLASAKKQCGHGEWSHWLAKACPEISQRQAQRYMRLAKNRDRLALPNATATTHLTLEAALDALAEPKPHTVTIEELWERELPAELHFLKDTSRAWKAVIPSTAQRCEGLLFLTPSNRNHDGPCWFVAFACMDGIVDWGKRPNTLFGVMVDVPRILGVEVDWSAVEWHEDTERGPTDRNPFAD